MAKWMVAAKKADFNKISREFRITPMTARLLRNRDLIQEDEIREYLYGDLESLGDPHMLADMDKAVQILQQKILAHRKIRVIGDYDVDGICSSYILLSGIRFCGGDVDCVLPDRIRDGYGLNEELIQNALEENTDTIITCDNGIAAVQQTIYAKEHGMTIVITDHHEIPFETEEHSGETREILPPADAIVDPKRADSAYEFREICGAVVAFRLLQVLMEQNSMQLHTDSERRNLMDEMLEFAALATVCDVMELRGENRVIVKEGLKKIQNSQNAGLRALIHVNQLEEKKISCYHLGYIIGPCLNATGRLDSALRGLSLLTADSVQEAARIAGDLKALNDSRKDMTGQNVDAAVSIVEKYSELPDVLVIFLPECHESIAGIVAGRIREKYGRPTLILTRAENGVKGSGRSVPAYDMYRELNRCSDLFTKFGGHKMAAGLSMKEADIQELKKRLNDACTLQKGDFEEILHIDMEMPLPYADRKLIQEISLLEPFGNGNARPLFAVRNVSILSGRILGRNRNCGKYKIMDENGQKYDMIYFGDMDRWQKFLEEKAGKVQSEQIYSGVDLQRDAVKINMAYYPDINSYQGRESLQIVMTDYM
ncbi:MAG: single-stranded-DNA-specific exonuclease RecJ [Butyrivibrio sp.]|jgi:single-stranded-DNA-specific exonuclease|nr:single-stranded-DNA-specific exonuclease RecJ [Butyrivibrio sp.]